MKIKKVLKVVNIDAQFPELKGGSCNQRGRGQGSSVKVAGARAFADLMRQKKLRRKHFTRFTAVVSIGTVVQENSETQTQGNSSQSVSGPQE